MMNSEDELDIFSILYKIKDRCVYSLESPHWTLKNNVLLPDVCL